MLVRFGEAGDVQRTLTSMPHHLVLDRSYVHGTSALDLKRCITLNSAMSAVVDSWLTECHSNNGDSQAVLGYNGAGPFKIENNYLAAGHEVVMFGGGDPGINGPRAVGHRDPPQPHHASARVAEQVAGEEPRRDEERASAADRGERASRTTGPTRRTGSRSCSSRRTRTAPRRGRRRAT